MRRRTNQTAGSYSSLVSGRPLGRAPVVDAAAAVLLALLILSASVTFVLNFRPLYTLVVDNLDIPAAADLSEQEVYENYDALIQYNSLFTRSELVFPSLAMSDGGRQHFREVKRIFAALQVVLIVTALCVPILLFLRRRNAKGILVGGGIVAVGLPVIAFLILLAAGWQRFFVGFHRLFFSNDLWIFDAGTDPVILILPDAYFMYCLIGILALTIFLSAMFVLIGLRLGRRRRSWI
ncbi:MAG: TIGR01906 family membrane protein [Clostridiales Family XIII bacterium]|jgi:integral membrane protein (TIGR01906 family)|nr:TIGR01906 family membrane protein [Clostridiales Family XIII bacterium]